MKGVTASPPPKNAQRQLEAWPTICVEYTAAPGGGPRRSAYLWPDLSGLGASGQEVALAGSFVILSVVMVVVARVPRGHENGIEV